MDYKLIWSPDALDDIEAIGDFISRDSEFYAESTVLKIYEAPRNLVNLPKQGRVPGVLFLKWEIKISVSCLFFNIE